MSIPPTWVLIFPSSACLRQKVLKMLMLDNVVLILSLSLRALRHEKVLKILMLDDVVFLSNGNLINMNINLHPLDLFLITRKCSTYERGDLFFFIYLHKTKH